MTITQNVVNVDYHVSRYKKIVAELRTEVAELKEKLARGGGVAKVRPQASAPSNPYRADLIILTPFLITSRRKQRSHRFGLR